MASLTNLITKELFGLLENNNIEAFFLDPTKRELRIWNKRDYNAFYKTLRRSEYKKYLKPKKKSNGNNQNKYPTKSHFSYKDWDISSPLLNH